jgi:hypothetical protein
MRARGSHEECKEKNRLRLVGICNPAASDFQGMSELGCLPRVEHGAHDMAPYGRGRCGVCENAPRDHDRKIHNAGLRLAHGNPAAFTQS